MIFIQIIQHCDINNNACLIQLNTVILIALWHKIKFSDIYSTKKWFGIDLLRHPNIWTMRSGIYSSSIITAYDTIYIIFHIA